MIFQSSKPSALTIWVALMVLTACSQPPNYAPVKIVNQAIESDNGYVVTKPSIGSSNRPNIPQASANIVQKGQQNKLIRQKPAINSSPLPNPHQNKPFQDHSTDPTLKQDVIRQSSTPNTKITNNNQSVSKLSPLPYQTEPHAKNKPANPVVDKFSVARQHKNLQQNAHQPESNPLTSKNNKEKTSIISIDNKKMLKLNFQWPIKGKISRNFAQTDNKGIDITGKAGQAVQAAEAGKAVYCGQGLVGFGNLAIIKHNATYLTAYANNSKLYIKEGQQVDKGQTIGQVGLTGLKKASLHFEIRKNGKPINPLTLMPKH
jgi:murein DD-endopeptidase MepM/ murein hydrolase activator NlpD